MNWNSGISSEFLNGLVAALVFRTRSPGFEDRQMLGDGILLPMTTLADPAEETRLAFETDRTLVAKAVRHSRFFARYVRARCHRKDLDGLMAAVERRFPDSKGWIAERRLEFRKTVGPVRNKDGIHWDAPIVVLIMYHDRHGQQKEACGMSLYIENNSLYILQLQGGKLVTFPRRFKVWPQLFLKSCIAFAEAANFNRVCVAKAETLYTYRWPDLGPNGIPRSQQSIDDHRKRMKLRYDETARVCDFKSEDTWFVWKNARLQRRGDAALNESQPGN